MSTFTIRITSPAVNAAGTGFASPSSPTPDLGAPSYFDMVVSNSTDPNLPNGVYDAYCLNPFASIFASPFSYAATNYAGNQTGGYATAGAGTLTQPVVDQINWLLSQNFTSDSKYASQFNYGEVQSAIWKLLGYTDAQIAQTTPSQLLTNNGLQVVASSDTNLLVSMAQAAVASGNGVVPTNAFFSTIIDPAGNAQPLIVQLQSAKLGNFVWQDNNANGVQDVGEAGVNGVIVELYDGSGTLVASTLTGDDFSTVAVELGYYQFAGLKAGDYQVKFIAPTYDFTAQDANSNTTDASDSDANALTGFSQVVTLAAGASNQTIDAGLVDKPTASLGDYVWADNNVNGQQDDGNTGVNGVTVRLLTAGGTLVATAVTANDGAGNPGYYLFSDLTPGDYKVEFVKPDGYIFTTADQGADGSDSDANTATGQTVATTLVSGENDLSWDAGLVKLASLGDRVWEDTNANGVQDDGEVGKSGVKVELYTCVEVNGVDQPGTLVATQTTDLNGNYNFTNLVPGDYIVKFIAADGSVLSMVNQGVSDATDSDAGAGGLTGCYELSAGEVETSVDAGFYKTASLGDYVWADNNVNGQQDDGNTGVNGVTVRLLTAGGTLVATAVTANDGAGNPGYYLFSDLTPGDYKVEFVKPDGYIFTTADQGADGSDSDANTATGQTVATTLVSGENDLSWDAGLVKLASLGDRVWEDTNANGVQDDGEVGKSGVKVELYTCVEVNGVDQPGTLVATQTTDLNGNYNFTNLVPGDYIVKFIAADGSVLSMVNQGVSDATDSDAGAGGLTGCYELSAGEVETSVDAGFYKTASLGDYVWADNNVNGQQDDGNTGVNGVTVRLLTAGGTLVATAVTANDGAGNPGYYLFSDLTPGDYKVEFVKPDGYIFTTADQGADGSDSDANTATGQTVATTLVSGENDLSWDAGLVKLASLGDRVWEDTNANGVQDDGEVGKSGVKVELYTCVEVNGVDQPGTLVATQTTDLNGNYNFTNLVPGDYIVKFIAADGSVLSMVNQGVSDATDSDAGAGGLTGCYELSAGEVETSVDAGFYKTASLGDYVWADNNVNGQQDDGNTGVNGVTVRLLTAGGTLVATAVTANDGAGNPGYYLFSDLTPGDYKVEFVKPDGYIFTTADQGADGSDSDANTATGQTVATTLVSGENDLSWDAGLVKLASLGDRVWEDTNANGVQDDGEVGKSGVKVELYTCVEVNGVDQPGTLVATQTTDLNGNYNFTNLVPGDYIVKFIAADGSVLSMVNQGVSDATDSDAGAGGLTGCYELSAGEVETSVDAGFYKTASLGDYVWADNNVNGQQDDGNTGVNGVTVRLLTAGGTLVATAVTANDGAGNPGYYLFSDLTPGDYKVEFVKPDGYIFTTADQGADGSDSDANTATGQTVATTLVSGENDLSWDAGLVKLASLGDRVWEDTNANGVQDDGEVGKSGVKVELYTCVEVNGVDQPGTLVATQTTDLNGNYNFTNLVPGDYIVKFIAADGSVLSMVNQGVSDATDSDAGAGGLTGCYELSAGEVETSVDAGFYKTASLGDYVWADNNVNGQQDDGNTGVNGVTVRLLTAGGTLVATAVTANDGAGNPGYYLFSDLTPGDYKVEFVKPDGYIFTTADQGADGSDSDANTATGQTVATTLVSGENDLSWDAGLVKLASLGDRVWEDTNANGVQDDGEVGKSGVKVELYTCVEVNGVDQPGTLVATQTTDLNGNYNFTNLVPGDYIVKFIAADGSVLSMVNQGVSDATDSDAGAGGLTGCYELSAGEVETSVDAGFYKTASLGDYVWADNNVNGQQDDGNTGVNGVTVRLLTAGGTLVATAVTANDGAGNPGYYLFSDLTPGDYKVEFVKPDGYIFTTADQGADGSDSDANTATGQTVATTLVSGENDLSWDAGLVKLASLGDRVWEDTNANGVQDDGEVGKSGVKVELYTCVEVNGVDQPGTLVATQTTDLNGNYNFTNLVPGDYIVKFIAADGSVLSMVNQGVSDATDSDAGAGGLTGCYELSAGEVETSVDAGFYKTASLGDYVWEDKNANGTQDLGEQGINNVKVELLGAGNVVLQTTFTAADGSYGFNVAPGTYTVRFTTPAGFVQTVVDQGLDATDSDAGAGGVTGTYTVASGQSNQTVDAGFYKLASLGDYVWLDNNNDGAQNDGNTGLNGVTVNLRNATGTVIATVVTAADANGNPGYYLFKDLVPGVYSVEFVKPAGYAFAKRDLAGGNDALDSDADTVTGRTITTTLESGENDLSWDAGLVKLASLGDRVWVDADSDGLQDAGEVGVVGATVTLIGGGADGVIGTGNDDTTVSTTTGANGIYRFDNLNVGEQYQVQFVAPVGTIFTQANVNANGFDTTDSDANTATGRSQIVTLAANQYNDTVDAGVVVLRPGIDIEKTTNGSSNSNTTAADYDNEDTANGAGVPVLTIGSDVTWTYKVTNTGNTTFDKSEVSIVDDNGTVGNTADDLTIANGRVTYVSGDADSDNKLDAGESWIYKATDTVKAQGGLGAAVSVDFSGNTALDGTDGNTRSYSAGGVAIQAQAWSRDKASQAWSKAYLGAYGGGLGVTDSSEGDGSGDMHTVDNVGRDNYVVLQFSQAVLLDKAFLGYVVCDSDLQVWIGNANSPITSMSNAVLSGLGFTEVNTTTSDAARWADLNAGGATGNVIVIAADTTDTSPEDRFKLEQLTFQAVQSGGVYANKATVTVGGVSDSDMSHYNTQVAKASIGDQIWYDKNANGLRDGGEVGVAGVKVDLIGANGAVVATTTTGADGKYLFSGLNPGDYHIDIQESTLPAGFVFTRANVGANDEIDSDVRATATQPLSWGKMDTTTLSAGEDDRSWDAGVYKVGIDVEKYVSSTLTKTTNNGGNEGADCNYWKNTCSWQWSLGSNGWAETGVKSTLSFNSVFGVNCVGGTQNLYQVLCGTGTSSREVMMRESVAAYLNACHAKVDYAYSKDQIVAHTKWGVETGRFDECRNAYAHENTKGCNWTTTKTNWDCVVATDLYDADAPPGLEVKTGSTVTFTYIVKNTGDAALKDVKLVDDRIASVTYVSGDTDKDGLLDTNETWTYTAKEVASSGTIKNTGTVTAVDAVGGVATVTDKDDAYYTGTGAAKSSLGDRVWEDKNGNGLQDGDEAGLSGVKVVLAGAGKDGVFGTKDDVSATTTTGANGLYEFNHLDAGKYTVHFQAGTGYFFTKANQGSNDAKDSDVGSDGKTGVITLDANEHDVTVDAGLFRKASVGDKVWHDWEHDWVQDNENEIGIANVKVSLLNASGAVISTTKTDSNGRYLFSELDPGTYQLQFDKTNVIHQGYNMNSWKFGKKDVGSNDAADSDVDGNGVSTANVSNTSQFTLHSGQNDMTRDAAITPIVIDLNGNGIQTVARADAGGKFDLFGSGKAVASGWLSGEDGFLAVDANGNGKIDGINELFGGVNKGDGFAKLASFDSNGDGLVNDLDAAFGQLLIWRDANGSHSTDAGELMGLADAGVASLVTSFTELPQLDAQGNLHLERSTATMADGQSVAMTDVYFNVSADDAAAAGVTLPTMADLLGNDNALDSLLGASPQSLGGLADCGDAACQGGEASEALRRLAALSREAAHTQAA